MAKKARDAWQKLYSKHGMQYGGSGEVSMLSPHLDPGMLVLDAGCGDGKTTEALLKRCEVIGCDFSKEALLSLRSMRDVGRSVNLVECELSYLPFESERFDAICCVHALSHMVKSERITAARDISRVLRPKGHLFLEVFGVGDLRYGEGEETESASFLRGNGILTHYFQEGELGRLFEALVVVHESRISKRVTYGATAGRRETLRALLSKV